MGMLASVIKLKTSKTTYGIKDVKKCVYTRKMIKHRKKIIFCI